MKRLILMPILCSCFVLTPNGLASDEVPRLQSNIITVSVVDLRILSPAENWFLLPGGHDETVESLREAHANVVALHGMNANTETRLRDQLQADYPFSVWSQTLDGERMAFLSRRFLVYPARDPSYDSHLVAADTLLGDRMVRLISAGSRSPKFSEAIIPEDPICNVSGDCIILTSRYQYHRWQWLSFLDGRAPLHTEAVPWSSFSMKDPVRLGDQDLNEMAGQEPTLRTSYSELRALEPAGGNPAGCSYCRDRGFMPRPCERCSRREEILFTGNLDLLRFSRIRIDLVDGDDGYRFSRPVPRATFAIKRTGPEAFPSLDFSMGQPGQTGVKADTSAPNRDRRPGPVRLPCP